jgi:hypothetical protein
MKVRLPALDGDYRVHTMEADRLTDATFRLNGVSVSVDSTAFRQAGAMRSVSGREQRSIEVNPASVQVLEFV